MSVEKEEVSKYGEKIVNTYRLQMTELSLYMNQEFGAIFDGVGFTNVEFGTQHSFNTAVKLFNEREGADDDIYMLERVKLHFCKKQKRIICKNHLVKLFNKEVLDDLSSYGVSNPFEIIYNVMKRLRLR